MASCTLGSSIGLETVRIYESLIVYERRATFTVYSSSPLPSRSAPSSPHQLLDELLFHVRDRDLLENAKDEHFETIYRVEEASAGIERARSGNGILNTRLETFQAHADAQKDELERGDELTSSYQETL